MVDVRGTTSKWGTTAVLGTLFMAAAAMPVAAAPAGRIGPNACRVAAPDIQAKDVCFTPARETVAERAMPLSPVHPGQVVWRLTGLRLRRLMLRVAGAPFDLVYLYGRMPFTGSPAVPTLSGTRPKYVLLSENTTLETRPPSQAIDSGGYWVASFNVVCRHLAVAVTTNISPAAAMKVARGMQARVPCGNK